MQAFKPIAYEILRRNDGMVAVSANAGLIGFEPYFVRIRKTSIFVHEKWSPNAGNHRAVELVNVSGDVLESVREENMLRFFEFASFGMTGSYSLTLQG